MGDAVRGDNHRGAQVGWARPGHNFTTMEEAGNANIYATEYIHNEETCACYAPCGGEREALLAETPPLPQHAIGEGDYPRLVRRDGETNVQHKDTRSRKVLSQWGFVFHVLIGMTAWKLVLLFFLSYLTSYFIVGAGIWFIHGAKAFHGVSSYWEAVIFTGYTMTTVGLGNQYPTDLAGNILPMIAVVFGLLMDAFWLGVIFARIASPRPLRHTILFSKRAVLHTEVGDSCLTFACRIVNLRVRYPWIDMSIKMTLASYDPVKKALLMSYLQVSDEAAPFLDVPWILRHRVTNDSPLKRMLSESSDFNAERGEIIIELNGQDPLTGNCMKKRFSYVADEIYNNYQFVNVLTSNDDAKDTEAVGYVVDLTRFHDMEPTETCTSSGAGYGAVSDKEHTLPGEQPLNSVNQL